jgi:hypothetical protein
MGKRKMLSQSSEQTKDQCCESKVALIQSNGAPQHNGLSPSVEDIRVAAYLKWEAAGKPICDGTAFWFDAEQAVRNGNNCTN